MEEREEEEKDRLEERWGANQKPNSGVFDFGECGGMWLLCESA
jgi:hypothetical protein